MNPRTIRLARLAPYALALALGLLLPAAARAQAAPVPAPAASEVRDLPLSAADRQRYAGSYTVHVPDGSRIVLRVFDDAGVLKGQPEGDQPSRLLYQGNHTFRPEANTALALVFTVVDDRATKFTVTREGQTMEGVRNP